jgi:hypothetical protein
MTMNDPAGTPSSRDRFVLDGLVAEAAVDWMGEVQLEVYEGPGWQGLTGEELLASLWRLHEHGAIDRLAVPGVGYIRAYLRTWDSLDDLVEQSLDRPSSQ